MKRRGCGHSDAVARRIDQVQKNASMDSGNGNRPVKTTVGIAATSRTATPDTTLRVPPSASEPVGEIESAEEEGCAENHRRHRRSKARDPHDTGGQDRKRRRPNDEELRRIVVARSNPAREVDISSRVTTAQAAKARGAA